MFEKSERSTFKYFFAHWCAFQMTALNLKQWKVKYLFHDIEKPWMLYWYMLVRNMDHEHAYKKVQEWHRTHRSHHLEYNGVYKDYYAMVIDWECSRFTKSSSPRNAYDEYIKKLQENKLSEKDIDGLRVVLEVYGLYGKHL